MNKNQPDGWEEISDYCHGIGVTDLLEHHPPGFARCFSAWWCDASISNSGFAECFVNIESTPRLLPSIQFYQRLEQPKMVEIFKTAALFIRKA